MPPPALRSLIGTPGTKIGTFLFEFATPGIGQILKAAGADYAVLDMEHTGFSFETVRLVVRYCQAAELPLIVRVPSQQRHHISRALDAGAEAIMVPIVSSVTQAKAVLDAASTGPTARAAWRSALPTSASPCGANRCSTASPSRTGARS